MPGVLRNPAGEISLQVSSIFSSRSRFVLVLLCGGALFSALSGCHRSPLSDVVATVNGKEIQRADLERNYQISLGDNPQALSPQEADIRRLNVLHQMIQNEILQQRAAKLNLTASDEDVNARLTELKAPYTQDQFFNLLKQRNMSLDDLKRDIRRQLTETKLINKEIESKINITDAEIATYYAAHKAEFARTTGRQCAKQDLGRCRPKEEDRRSVQSAGERPGFRIDCRAVLRRSEHGLNGR